MMFHAKVKKIRRGYQIQFVELPNIVTYCDRKDDVLETAHDALIGCIEADIDQFLDIPIPRLIKVRNTIAVSIPLNLTCAILFRRLRKEQGLTTMEVAQKLGISRQAYERLESSRSNPSTDTIEKVLRILGISDIEIKTLAA